MVRKHGTDLSFTQMINAKVFLKSSTYQREVVDWLDYPDGQHSTALGDFCKSWDRPLIVQLAGDDPETLLSVAKMIVMHGEISAIDLNLGCPQNIAKRGHYGAYLLPDTDLVLKILSTLSEKVDCPITAKIRKLPKDEDTIALVQSIEQCGVQMVTVHGRYPSQRKQYTGTADWDIIKNVKESVNIPIVANGGISSLYDAKRCLEYTRADAVMSSEALLENPRLFSEKGSHDFEHDFVRSQLENARELVHYFQIFPQRRSSTSSLRAHLFKMLHRFLSSPIHHDLRFSLTKCSIDEMMDMVCELHKRLERVNFQTENALKQGLLVSSSWYSRHRNHSDQRLCNKNDE
jgi:tRNA-dihydrouridine synthase